MVSKIDKNAMRLKRHVRVRGKISGTPERPRLNVFRSNANIYAQIIDDVNGVTLASANTLEKEFEGLTGNCEGAKKVGAVLAERAKARASARSFSTAVAIFSMAVLLLWLRVPARAASSSKEEEENKWLTIRLLTMKLPSSLRRSFT